VRKRVRERQKFGCVGSGGAVGAALRPGVRAAAVLAFLKWGPLHSVNVRGGLGWPGLSRNWVRRVARVASRAEKRLPEDLDVRGLTVAELLAT
jgi:hypothetical protein